MKKLLGMLGVVTITGSGLTTLTSNNFLSTNVEKNENYLQKLQNDPTIQQDINNKRFVKVLVDGTWTYVTNLVPIPINVGIVIREVQLRYLVSSNSDWIAWIEQQESLIRTYHPEQIPESQASQHLQYNVNGEASFTHWVSDSRVNFSENQVIFVNYLNKKYKEAQKTKERERMAAQSAYNDRVQSQQQTEREYYRTKLNEFNNFKANNRALWISNMFGDILTPLVSNTINYEGGKFTFDWTPVTLLWWKFKIDNVGCQKLLKKMDSPEVAIVTIWIQQIIEGLLSVISGPVAGKVLTKLASASVDINIFILKWIIENKNQGNGVWIGFWINQPGIGWGSL